MIGAPLPWAFVLMLVSLPLVQVGTLPTPVRFILPDFLALCLAGAVLLNWRQALTALSRRGPVAAASAAGVLLCLTTIGSSAISLAWITPLNFQQWVGHDNLVKWSGAPIQRAVIENARLLQCVAALVVTLSFVNTSNRLMTAAQWYVVGATIAAAYGLYIWSAMVGGIDVPMLPGTFSYVHLKRTAATFPEPGAYAGYALTGIVLTAWMLERGMKDKWPFVALGIQLVAAVTSLSTLVVLGLATMWAGSFLGRQRKAVAALSVAGAAAIFIVLTIMPTGAVRRAIQKPFTTHASWLDRVTAWHAATRMTAEYPAVGVGAGLYAYNQARFLAPGDSLLNAGGRINSPALEIAAESGLLGAIALTVILIAASIGAARAGHGYGGLRATGVLAVLIAGYYTSRYSFLWVYAALLVAGVVVESREPARSPAAVGDEPYTPGGPGPSCAF